MGASGTEGGAQHRVEWAVGAAAEAAGGTLSLDWDHCGVPREAVTDRGVVLDVPVPEDPMTHEEYSAPWPG